VLLPKRILFYLHLKCCEAVIYYVFDVVERGAVIEMMRNYEVVICYVLVVIGSD
jgi:hypothetical protein